MIVPSFPQLFKTLQKLSRARGLPVPAWGVVVGCAALSVAGCGGGESFSPTLPVTTVVEYFPTVVNVESGASMRRGQLVDVKTGSLVGPDYGDTWMYQWINKTAGTGFYSTHYLSALEKTTQLYSHTVTFSDTQPFQTRDLGSKNQNLATSTENTRCQDNTQTRSAFPRRPYAVGNTWTYVWSETCLNGTVATVVNKTITGRVTALETRNLGLLGQGGVALGGTTQRAFQTARYTATRTESNTAGAWSYQDICWHDIAQDRTVQCDTIASFTPAGGAVPTQSFEQSQTLAFVREVRTPSPVRLTDGPTTVAMYAGRWEFKLVGTGGTVTCTNMVISLTGNVSGNCTRVVTTLVTRPDPNNPPAGTVAVPILTTTAFTVSGSVQRGKIISQAEGAAASTRDADVINVVADSGVIDLSLSGEMLSPFSALGTSLGAAGTSGGTPAEGTWSARHL